MKFLLKTSCLLSLLFVIGCKTDKSYPLVHTNGGQAKTETAPNNQFNDYWYAGKAELNSYSLKQSQYGKINEGEIVLVFVTEPFSLSKQVKLDNGNAAGTDKVSVMKLNQIRKFVTGIYDYAIMSSTFTPVDITKYPNTLKITTSMQEWCGNSFTQLNLKDKKYEITEYSYFESEGDTKKSIPAALVEEELMTRIRINKGQLPLGETDLIFSALSSRMGHRRLQVAKANISKKEMGETMTYSVDYTDFNRTITIDVQKEFPYKILGWTEDDGRGLVTEARLLKTLNEPYWSQKSQADEARRKELQLKY